MSQQPESKSACAGAGEGQGGSEGQGGIQIIHRVLDIIEILAHSEKPLGPTGIAQETGLNKSTVHRLLATLHLRGYVEKNEDGAYYLGAKFIELAGCYIDSLELIAEARPYLSQLTGDLNLTAHLGILDKTEVIYVERLDTLPTKRIDCQIGYRVPASCSSLGKCLLAGLSSDELEETYGDYAFVRYTSQTITSLSDLRRHLRQVRSQGWALDNCEYQEEHRCIAAPIYDYRGTVIAAISASGSTNRLTDQCVPTVSTAVKGYAARISRRLGYVG